MQDEQQQDSNSSMVVKRSHKRKKGKGKMDELKQELEMDEHRIPVEELCRRLGTDPDKVCGLTLLRH